MQLNMADIQRLAQDSSAEAREDIAGKVAAMFCAGALSDKERLLAEDILRALAQDTESRVRKAVAEHLAGAISVPHDLVRALADDVAEVSAPLLLRTFALSEQELVEIVRATRELAKLVAIASRESISSDLSEALLETRITEVIHALLSNRGALIRDQQFVKYWDLIAGNESLLAVLVRRGGLSLAVAEKLYGAVSSEMKLVMARSYRLPMVVVDEAAEAAHEWHTLAMAGGEDSGSGAAEHEIERLISHLYLQGRLTPSLVIRALCLGDIVFFEAALAKLAGVERVNARILLFDGGELGFRAIYAKAKLPDGFYDALHALLRISLEETSYGRFRREDFRNRLVQRIRAAGYEHSLPNMSYLLTIIGGKGGTPGTIH